MAKRRLSGSSRPEKRHEAEEVGERYPDTWGRKEEKDGVREFWSLFKSITDSFATYWTWRLPD